MTFVTGSTSVVSMGQEPIETTLVAAGPLRTHSYPAAVDVRWASTIHVRAPARGSESVIYAQTVKRRTTVFLRSFELPGRV